MRLRFQGDRFRINVEDRLTDDRMLKSTSIASLFHPPSLLCINVLPGSIGTVFIKSPPTMLTVQPSSPVRYLIIKEVTLLTMRRMPYRPGQLFLVRLSSPVSFFSYPLDCYFSFAFIAGTKQARSASVLFPATDLYFRDFLVSQSFVCAVTFSTLDSHLIIPQRLNIVMDCVAH
jgi:hypothetical protein